VEDAAQDDGDQDFEDEEEDTSDEEYDAIADCDLYDSAMDKIDELQHTRDTMAQLEQQQPQFMQALLAGVDPAALAKMQQ